MLQGWAATWCGKEDAGAYDPTPGPATYIIHVRTLELNTVFAVDWRRQGSVRDRAASATAYDMSIANAPTTFEPEPFASRSVMRFEARSA